MTTSITLFLAGDVMTGRGVDQILPDPCEPTLYEPYVQDARQYVALVEEESGDIEIPVSPDYIWGETLEILEQKDPDVRVVNLETSLTRSGDYWQSKGIHYRMSPENADALEPAGLDVCSLANNHVLDWGYAGLEETLTTLKQRSIRYAGAGRNITEARTPSVFDLHERGRVLVFGLCAGDAGVPSRWAAGSEKAGVFRIDDFSQSTVAEVGEHVQREKRAEDIAVASIHWGGNWGYDIPEAHIHFGRGLIDEAGIDLVHGHSSHHVKAFEIHRDKLILYGCGDLLTDYEGIGGHEQYRGELGLMYFPQLEAGTGHLLDLEMWPTRVRRISLTRPSSEDVDWLMDVLDREGARFNLNVENRENGCLAVSDLS